MVYQHHSEYWNCAIKNNKTMSLCNKGMRILVLIVGFFFCGGYKFPSSNFFMCILPLIFFLMLLSVMEKRLSSGYCKIKLFKVRIKVGQVHIMCCTYN